MRWAWQLSWPESYNMSNRVIWSDLCFRYVVTVLTPSSALPPPNTHVDHVRVDQSHSYNMWTKARATWVLMRTNLKPGTVFWPWSNQPTPVLCRSHTEAEVKNVVEPLKLVSLDSPHHSLKDSWPQWSPPWSSQPKGNSPLKYSGVLNFVLTTLWNFFLALWLFCAHSWYHLFSLCLILKAYM